MKQSRYQFNPSILREYDIRGIVDDTLTETDAFFIGCSFGTFIKRRGGNSVCTAYDGRDSSPIFSKKLIEGLISTGIEVINLGLGPTPMLYYGVKQLETDGGIMITGSHNPSDYNGFKMMVNGHVFYGEDIQNLGLICSAADFESGDGNIRELDIQDQYVDRLIEDLNLNRELKIAWDNGNGSSGEILRRLSVKVPGEHILLYDEIDSNFPNHHPDPTVSENLVDLQKCVLDNKCDMGIAFDGDGDRIGVIDEKGNIVSCDALLTLYSKEIIEQNPKAKIIADVKCSQFLFDEIDKMGGKSIMWKTGHSLIKSKMSEENSPFAGELSGHIFFADKYYGYDDALYCAIRLINIVSASENSLSSHFEHLPQLYNTPEIRIEVDENIKFQIVPKIIENLKSQKDYKISKIDGIRISNDDGWWILRPSNTQNALSARVEANSPEALKDLKNMLQKEISNAGIEAKI